MADSAKQNIQSISNAIEIVDALQTLGGCGVSELSEHLDLPKSSVHNYLSTLVDVGLVVKEGTTYRTGLGFLEYGGYARSQRRLFQAARPEVEELATRTGELTNLLIEEHGRGTYVYQARGDRAVNLGTTLGTRVYLHQTALGKAILAFLPERRRREIIDTHGLPGATPSTITDEDALRDELATIRDERVAFDDGERAPNVCCVAVPIVVGGTVHGAVSVSGPASRMSEERARVEIPEALLETANIIELELEYS